MKAVRKPTLRSMLFLALTCAAILALTMLLAPSSQGAPAEKECYPASECGQPGTGGDDTSSYPATDQYRGDYDRSITDNEQNAMTCAGIGAVSVAGAVGGRSLEAGRKGAQGAAWMMGTNTSTCLGAAELIR